MNTKYTCSKCGKAAEADEKFCSACGAPTECLTHQAMMFCATCGKQIEVSNEFCPFCGQFTGEKTQPSTVIQNELTYSSGAHKNNPSLLKKVGLGIATCIGVCLIAGAFLFAVPSSRQYLPSRIDKWLFRGTTIKEQAIDTQLQSSKNVAVEKPIESKPSSEQIATITCNDVILRSLPSIAGTELGYLNRSDKVTVLLKETNSDPNAAIATRDFAVRYNGQNISIQKGQAIQLGGTSNGKVRGDLKINNRDVTVYLDHGDYRRIMGETWYKVRTNGGNIGWVYGEFVKI